MKRVKEFVWANELTKADFERFKKAKAILSAMWRISFLGISIIIGIGLVAAMIAQYAGFWWLGLAIIGGIALIWTVYIVIADALRTGIFCGWMY